MDWSGHLHCWRRSDSRQQARKAFQGTSEALDEAAGEEARLARTLQGPLEPAVLPLLVDVHHVALLQLQFVLAVGRIRHDAAESAMHIGPEVSSAKRHASKQTNFPPLMRTDASNSHFFKLKRVRTSRFKIDTPGSGEKRRGFPSPFVPPDPRFLWLCQISHSSVARN